MRVVPAAKYSIVAPHLRTAYTPAEGPSQQGVKLAILHDLDAGWMFTGSEDAGAAAVGLSATTISAEPEPACDEHLQAAYSIPRYGWGFIVFSLLFAVPNLALTPHGVPSAWVCTKWPCGFLFPGSPAASIEAPSSSPNIYHLLG